MSHRTLKPVKSDGAKCKCEICGKSHTRRDGQVNISNPICEQCAEKFGGIPQGHGPKDKVNIKMRNWK